MTGKLSDGKTVPAPLPPHPDETLRRELLLRDFEHWTQSFWRNEEAGERRVQFFIGLVTAVMAGLGALYGYVAGADGSSLEAAARAVRLAALPALAGLFVVGFVTFLRMVHRDRVTDDYKERMDQVRRLIYGDLAHHWLYHPRRLEKEGSDGTPVEVVRSWLSGGLAMTVAMLDGLLAGVFAALWVTQEDAGRVWVAGIGTGLATVALHALVMGWRYHSAHDKRESRKATRDHWMAVVQSRPGFRPE